MAKKSRRARKLVAEKQGQVNQAINPAPEVNAVAPAPVQPQVASAPVAAKTVDFGLSYYYVYAELRNIAIVAVVMFALMLGLGYFI